MAYVNHLPTKWAPIGEVELRRLITVSRAARRSQKLGAATGVPPMSLIRMFGPRGNPQAKNLFNVIGYLQKQARVHLHVAQR